MAKKTTGVFITPVRAELLRAAALAVVAVLLWCAHYDRWTAASWQTPVEYLTDVDKSDVLIVLAWGQAAAGGHISPVFYNNVPELGAPGVANWNDFPLPEKPIFIAIGWLAHAIGLFAAENAILMAVQVLAVLGFYAAARMLGSSWEWAAAGGIVFAFSRYEFAQGLHHLAITSVWHVPLDLVVCEWLFRGEVGLRGRNFLLALLLAVATGAQNVYYAVLFGQFVLFAGLYQAWRGGWRQALPAVAILGGLVATFLFMNLHTLIYRLANGPGGAVVRVYQWLEVYGLKLVDLVIPPPDHPFPPFADWGQGHLHEVVLSPGEMPPTGYIGLIGLAALAWLVLFSLRRAALRLTLPLEAFLILWIVVFACVGGINGVIGTLGFQLLRSTTRYSIVVLAIVLLFAARRLSAFKFAKAKWLPAVAAVIAAAFALWDQPPPAVTDEQLAALAAQVAADRKFTGDMARQLPAGAMVFQLPAMEFPEGPAPGMPPYDHLRPYLYDDMGLRFSFGTDKGRASGEWQKMTGQLPPNLLVDELLRNGFGAIYVNRGGYQDHAAALLAELKSMGYTDVIENERGDVFCVVLRKEGNP